MGPNHRRSNSAGKKCRLDTKAEDRAATPANASTAMRQTAAQASALIGRFAGELEGRAGAGVVKGVFSWTWRIRNSLQGISLWRNADTASRPSTCGTRTHPVNMLVPSRRISSSSVTLTIVCCEGLGPAR